MAEEQQSEAELPPLKIDETERIIARLEQVVRDRRVVLVGGQAVAIWAAKLEDRIADTLVDAVASRDIDFSRTSRLTSPGASSEPPSSARVRSANSCSTSAARRSSATYSSSTSASFASRKKTDARSSHPTVTSRLSTRCLMTIDFPRSSGMSACRRCRTGFAPCAHSTANAPHPGPQAVARCEQSANMPHTIRRQRPRFCGERCRADGR